MINYIPNSVKINHINYDVKVTDKPIIINNSSNYAGCIDFEKSEIKINSSLSKYKKIETLWHEILHGIVDLYNMNFKEDDEERIVDLIAKGVLSVLQNNNIKDE